MSVKSIAEKLLLQPVYNLLGFFYYFKQKIYFPKNSLLFRRKMRDGFYEPSNIALISNLLEDESYYFDVGANIGLMAAPLLEMNKNCKIVSFEASPTTLPYIQKTIANSKHTARWKLITDAAYNQVNAKLDFHIAEEKNSAYDSFADTKRANFLHTKSVRTTTVDYVWQQFGRPHVSFIKSDTEGADLFVLQGSEACIKKCRPYILVEWHYLNIKAFDIKPEAIFAFCGKIEYDCYALPNNVPLQSEDEVKVAIRFSENFLLSPKEKDVKKYISPF